MKKQSVATSVLIIFLSIIFAVIGSCFMAFIYKDNKIEVEEIKLLCSQNIQVFSDENLTNSVTELELSELELGLKPATGELNAETQIPSTINDQGTTEGYYSTIYVSSLSNFKVSVVDVLIDSKEDENKINEERENIFISIKDVNESTKSLENETTKLAEFTNVSGKQKLTFYIWLGSLADTILEGSKISFSLKFETI